MPKTKSVRPNRSLRRRATSRIIGGQTAKSIIVGSVALTLIKTLSRMTGLTTRAGRFGQPVETLITGVALNALGSSGSDLVGAGVKEVASESIEYGISFLGGKNTDLFGTNGTSTVMEKAI